MKKLKYFIILLIICGYGCIHKTSNDKIPLVETSFGKISGQFANSIYSFKGIPYAKANRFMPPDNPDYWDGTLQCNQFGPVARQKVAWIPDSSMDEKNLFSLNIWTKGLDNKKRPVMLWLHGGGFRVGSSNDPMTYGEALSKKGDIVTVSINHRLNILGFLDLSAYGEEYTKSANIGMLDIIKGLQWIHNNIEKFGGNPDDITIVGESGGGGKVGTLMCMPEAKGLFQKAIIQSGTLLNTMTKDKSQQLASSVLKHLGVTFENIKHLDTISYENLAQAGNKAIEEITGTRKPGSPTIYGFVPSVDGEVLLQQPFSPGFSNISNNIPLMMGTTLNELTPTMYGEKNLTEDIAISLLKKKYGNRTEEYITLFSEAYPNYVPQDLLSIDTTFRPNTIRTVDARAKEAKAPLYVYFLGWKSSVEDSSKGSFHGLDIPLAFNNVELKSDWTGNTAEAFQLADKMSSAWINFIKNGNPNVEGALPKWNSYSVNEGNTMYFDSECRIVNNHDRRLMNFIESFH